MSVDLLSVINFRELGYSADSETATATNGKERDPQQVSEVAVLLALAESEIHTRVNEGAKQNVNDSTS